MVLFQIGRYDVTTHIMVPTYSVNSMDVTNEWTDGFKVKHKDVVRTRISGSFTCYFDDMREYHRFLDAVNDNKDEAGGYVSPVSIYVNNMHDIKRDVKVYITVAPSNTVPIMAKQHEGFTVTIEEM